jgi:hypothetical protein
MIPSDQPTPPEGLPDTLVDDLNQLSADELRKAVIHAQELLRAQEEHDPPVDPGPGEDILQVTEYEGYTEVVKQFRCADGCDECPHGPYLYQVKEETHPDGDTHTKWSFIGAVEDEEA